MPTKQKEQKKNEHGIKATLPDIDASTIESCPTICHTSIPLDSPQLEKLRALVLMSYIKYYEIINLCQLPELWQAWNNRIEILSFWWALGSSGVHAIILFVLFWLQILFII